jgi:hypothetical protein
MPGKMLYIFCEGHTEESILRNFFYPYWSIRFSHCEIIRYSGAGDLKVRFAADAEQELRTNSEASVLCLLDLYEEPFGVYDKARMTKEEGFEKVKRQLEVRIRSEFHHRFGAFPVVMEVETWLLADPNIQAEIGETYSAPEQIAHPTQHLREWRSNYKKRIDGKNLFQKVSVKRVYEDNCPHFRLIVDWLSNEPERPISPLSLSQQAWQVRLNQLLSQQEEVLLKIREAEVSQNTKDWLEWNETSEAIQRDIQEHAESYGDVFP